MQRRALLSVALSTFSPIAARAAQGAAVVRQAWLGDADRRHGHDALGTGRYPGTLHATVEIEGRVQALRLDLPADAAFEDGVVRRVSLEDGASGQLLVVRASRSDGGAIAVYGVRFDGNLPVLQELARSPAVGPGRWLNPVGIGDFDGDGRPEVVGVSTPHIGGVLTLYRYRPPQLLPVARIGDVSNHVYGRQEQSLAAIVRSEGRLAVAIPDQTRRRLRSLALSAAGAWEPAAADIAFDQPIDRITPLPTGGVLVESGAGSRVVTWR